MSKTILKNLKVLNLTMKGNISEKKEIAGTEGITVKGHTGTWYVIDAIMSEQKLYFLLESEQHGEDANGLIIDSNNNLILEDVYNGFDDLREHFKATDSKEVLR